MREGRLPGSSHRNVIGYDCDFPFQIEAETFIAWTMNRIGRSEEYVRAALIHQRINPERNGHLRAPGLSHERDMVHVGRAIDPLVGSRQRCSTGFFAERNCGYKASLELFRSRSEGGSDTRPVIERGLHRWRNAAGENRARQVS